MRKYLKPKIEEEIVEIEDIMVGSTLTIQETSPEIVNDPDAETLGGNNQ